MSNPSEQKPGTIAWHDLTVKNADVVKDFYAKVVGWTPRTEAAEGGDFNMIAPATGDPAAGVCWARGVNADLPPQWLMYILVEDVDACAATAKKQGGKVIAGPRQMGGAKFCVIQDPAGAVCALYQAKK